MWCKVDNKCFLTVSTCSFVITGSVCNLPKDFLLNEGGGKTDASFISKFKLSKQERSSNLFEVFITSLPKVSYIEVVSLEPLQKERNGMLVRFQDPINPTLDALERGNPSFLANGSDAHHIAGLYRQLEPDMQYRCHLPPYGFKFHLVNSNVVIASLCWRCNNAAVWISSSLHKTTGFTFNGESQPALELLNICRRYLPNQ